MNTNDFLDAILAATTDKRLSWGKTAPGLYQATGQMNILIQEICPLVAGDTETIGVQAFQVTANNLIVTFWSGSDSYHKVREILSAGVGEFSEHDRLLVERINAAARQLQK